jgi:hypothetical protein
MSVMTRDTIIKDIYPQYNTYFKVMGESSPFVVENLLSRIYEILCALQPILGCVHKDERHNSKWGELLEMVWSCS